MSRKLNPRIPVAFVLFSTISLSVHAQVVLQLNALHFKAYDPINVAIINRQSRAISVCVSEQWIPKPNGDVGVAATPLLLQGQRNGKWVTVLNGVDVGPPMLAQLTIEPHQSKEFQFQTKGNGKARFVLYYWIGDKTDPCHTSRRGKKAVSPTFTLAASG